MRKNIQKYRLETIILLILFSVYFTWFLIFVNKGIDLTDIPYVLTLYKYVFNTDTQNAIGVALTTVIGGVLWRIIPSAQVLILNVVAAFLYAVDGLLVYRMLKKYVSPFLLFLMMLSASFFAVSWVRILHYNTWSMFFLTIEIYLLNRWFEETKLKYICFCGIMYGINIWIRIPNCMHGICLLAVIWYIINKGEKKLWFQFVCMLFGALGGFLLATVIVLSVFGTDKVVSGIVEIYLTGKTSNDGHSYTSMLQNIGLTIYLGIKVSMLYLSGIGMFCGIENVFLRIYRKLTNKNLSSTVMHRISICLGSIYAIFVFRYMYRDMWAVAFYIVISVILSGVGWVVYRKTNLKLSALCMVTVLLELTITIGTNNGVMWNILFLFLPLGMIAFLCINLSKAKFYNYGVLILAFVVTLVFLGGAHYASTYVYRDSPIEELDSQVESKIYRGMKTSVERAMFIDCLSEQLNALPEGELISMGNCTIGSVISDLKPAIAAWPDVSSYSYEQFDVDIDRKIEQGMKPYILLVNTQQEHTIENEKKYRKIWKIIEENSYRQIYSDINFTLYSP